MELFWLKDGTKFNAVLNKNNHFYGYYDLSKIKKNIDGTVYTNATSQILLLAKLLDYNYAVVGGEVQSTVKKFLGSDPIDCYETYIWGNKQSGFSEIEGAIKRTDLLPDEKELCGLFGDCSSLDGLLAGVGASLYLNNKEDAPDEQKLKELANYITRTVGKKTYAFYGYAMEHIYCSQPSLPEDIIRLFNEEGIFDRTTFNTKFRFICSVRDKEVIFSKTDLWEDIIPTYNENTLNYATKDNLIDKYVYSFSDLVVIENFRENFSGFLNQGFLSYSLIKRWEAEGIALPLSTYDYSEQSKSKAKYEKILKAVGEAITPDEVSLNFQISEIPLPTHIFINNGLTPKLLVRPFVRYDRVLDKTEIVLFTLIYCVPMSKEVYFNNIGQPSS